MDEDEEYEECFGDAAGGTRARSNTDSSDSSSDDNTSYTWQPPEMPESMKNRLINLDNSDILTERKSEITSEIVKPLPSCSQKSENNLDAKPSGHLEQGRSPNYKPADKVFLQQSCINLPPPGQPPARLQPNEHGNMPPFQNPPPTEDNGHYSEDHTAGQSETTTNPCPQPGTNVEKHSTTNTKKPMKFYLCVDGIDQAIDTDTLINYMEVRSGMDIIIEESIRTEEKPQHAVLVFEDAIDIKDLEEACEKNLGESKFEFEELPPPRSIVASSDDDKFTVDAFKDYLSKEIKLHVVRSTEMNGVITAKLKSESGVPEILKHPYLTINGCRVTVSVMYFCSHGAYWNKSLHSLSIPLPLNSPADKLQERINNMPTERIKIMPLELTLLRKLHKLEKLHGIAPEFSFTINEKTGNITFTGVDDDILKATVIVIEAKKDFSTWQVDTLSSNQCKLLQNKDVIEMVRSEFASKNISIAFAAEDHSVDVCTEHKDQRQIEHVFKEVILEECISLNNASKVILSQVEWADKKNELKNNFPNIVILDDSSGYQIKVTTVCSVLDVIVEEINNFVKNHSISPDTITIPHDALYRYLKQHCKDQLRDFELINSSQKLKIHFEANPIKLSGTEMVMQIAQQEIQKMVAKIDSQNYLISKPGLGYLFCDPYKAQSIIDVVEEESETTIVVDHNIDTTFHRHVSSKQSDKDTVNVQSKNYGKADQVDLKENSVCFTIYYRTQDSLLKAKKLLENSIAEQYMTDRIKDRDLTNMVDYEFDFLKSIGDRYQIKMTIDTSGVEVILEGLIDDVMAAKQDVFDALRKFSYERHCKTMAALIQDQVQWYYKVTGSSGLPELIPYPAMVNMDLETAYKGESGRKKVEFKDDQGQEYEIVLRDMKAYVKHDRSQKHHLIRREKMKGSAGSFELPTEWDKQGNENVKVIHLPPSSPEFKAVQKKFIDSVFSGRPEWRQQFNKSTLTVTKIERVQNESLYQMYAAKKMEMESQNPSGTKNEMQLWHGTPESAVNIINFFGFNRSYCQHNSTDAYWGDGVYFSADASYSARGWLAPGNLTGEHNIYLCNVLTGVSCKGQRWMRYLPMRPDGTMLNYNSATDTNYNPTVEYVIFNDTQAYPRYCIKFKY